MNIKSQIKAINKAIENGKCKNPYAAKNKVNQLKKKAAKLLQQNNWNNFLSR